MHHLFLLLHFEHYLEISEIFLVRLSQREWRPICTGRA